MLVLEKDGGLTVRASVVSPGVNRLGRVLSGAEATIVAAVKHAPGPSDPDTLPDAQLTLSGDLLPPKLHGHGEAAG